MAAERPTARSAVSTSQQDFHPVASKDEQRGCAIHRRGGVVWESIPPGTSIQTSKEVLA